MVDEKTIEELRALLAKAEDAAARMAQNKSSLTDLITFRSIVNAIPALLDAAERASRAREDALREAIAVAKMIADAMRPHEKEPCESVGATRVAAAIRGLIDKPKGGDANANLRPRSSVDATSPGVTAGASAGPAAPVDGGEDA